MSETPQGIRALEIEAAHAEHALNERVKQGGTWEKSHEFYHAMWVERQAQNAREALTAERQP